MIGAVTSDRHHLHPTGGQAKTGENTRDEMAELTRATDRKLLVPLRQILTTLFSEDDLRTLCFDLGIDYDVLPGEGKASKAVEMLISLERHNHLSDLIEVGKQLRPDIAWLAISTVPHEGSAPLENISAEQSESQAAENTQTRRQILHILYEASKSSAVRQVTFNTLVERLGIAPEAVKFHLDYLHKKKWVLLDQKALGAQIFRYCEITLKGIDLVEEPSEFNRELPVIVQHVHQYGDTITVGNITDSTGIAIGRGHHINITRGISAQDLQKLFDDIKIQTTASIPGAHRGNEVDQILIAVQEAIWEAEGQVTQGNSPDEIYLRRQLKELGRITPDILLVVAATLANPLAGLSQAVQKIVQKVADEASKPSSM